MTTSSSYNFSQNRDQIIKSAGRKIGAWAAGETPDSQTLNDFSDALNAMVKEWEASGIHVWTETEAILFLEPDQQQYMLGSGSDNVTQIELSSGVTYQQTTLSASAITAATTITVDSITGFSNGDNIGIVVDDGTTHWTTINGVPAGSSIVLTTGLDDSATAGLNVWGYTSRLIKPLRVPSARRLNWASNLETPMLAMSRMDYMNLPNKAATGTPTQFFYTPQRDVGYMYIWPVCTSSTDAIRFTWYRPIQDFDAAADTADLPQEWISTLIFNLAVEMASEYGLPLPYYQMLKERADAKLGLLAGWDREEQSTMFGVDFSQMGR